MKQQSIFAGNSREFQTMLNVRSSKKCFVKKASIYLLFVLLTLLAGCIPFPKENLNTANSNNNSNASTTPTPEKVGKDNNNSIDIPTFLRTYKDLRKADFELVNSFININAQNKENIPQVFSNKNEYYTKAFQNSQFKGENSPDKFYNEVFSTNINDLKVNANKNEYSDAIQESKKLNSNPTTQEYLDRSSDLTKKMLQLSQVPLNKNNPQNNQPQFPDDVLTKATKYQEQVKADLTNQINQLSQALGSSSPINKPEDTLKVIEETRNQIKYEILQDENFIKQIKSKILQDEEFKNQFGSNFQTEIVRAIFLTVISGILTLLLFSGFYRYFVEPQKDGINKLELKTSGISSNLSSSLTRLDNEVKKLRQDVVADLGSLGSDISYLKTSSDRDNSNSEDTKLEPTIEDNQLNRTLETKTIQFPILVEDLIQLVNNQSTYDLDKDKNLVVHSSNGLFYIAKDNTDRYFLVPTNQEVDKKIAYLNTYASFYECDDAKGGRLQIDRPTYLEKMIDGYRIQGKGKISII